MQAAKGGYKMQNFPRQLADQGYKDQINHRKERSARRTRSCRATRGMSCQEYSQSTLATYAISAKKDARLADVQQGKILGQLGDTARVLRAPLAAGQGLQDMGAVRRRHAPSTKAMHALGLDVLETPNDFDVVKKWPSDEGKPRLLLSNPPFSQKFKVLEALVEAQEDGEVKPFMILLPSWVYASATWRKLVRRKNLNRRYCRADASSQLF